MEKTLELSSLINPIKDTFYTISDEWSNFFEFGLEQYLYSQLKKYYYTNTFLHRGEQVKFYDIYHPIKATYKELITDFEDIESIFENYSKIIISGSAGSGKTTLIKHLFLQSIKNRVRIPILIELRHLNDYDGSIEKLITDKILNNSIKPNATILKRALRSGKFIFLLDGYDEIFSNKKNEINRHLEEFIDQYSKNIFFISTRPGSGIEVFSRFNTFKVNKLDDDDVVSFVDKVVQNEERNKRIKDVIVLPDNNSYLEFLRNPLLLSMFILSFENHPEIPQKKNAFYRNVFDTLYSKHDGITKNSFPREKLTKLQREDFETILSRFAFVSSVQGDYMFTEELLVDIIEKIKKNFDKDFDTKDLIYDLYTTISILVLDGFEYYFPHRSMQEYFTALFISKLPPNKKADAYKKLFNVLKESTNDKSFTLWNLCIELDNITFTREFILPKLKDISKKLNVSDKSKRLNNFLDIINPVFVNINGSIHIYRIRYFQNSFIEFCKILDYSLITNLLSDDSHNTEKVIKLMKVKKTNYLKITSRTHTYKKILIEKNIDDIISNISRNIDKKIYDLEHLEAKQTIDIEELLK